jgi:PRC-barrel domain
MLHAILALKGFEIAATDGSVGSIEDAYFDDQRWTIRYFVVNTGGWLGGRRVLISPHAMHEVDPAQEQVRVALTRERVEKSPPIETDRPVSRQQEAEYAQYFGYPAYWTAPVLLGAELGLIAPPLGVGPAHQDAGGRGDPHLRSCAEVTGYAVAASDGEIGHVDDFLFDDETWAIRYLVLATRNWWPGKRVLVSPEWFDRIDWAERTAFAALSRAAIESSPEYDPAHLPGRDYEEALHRHYGKPSYWSVRDEPVTPLSGK